MRKITERDREIWRQNALRGTEKTKGRRRGSVQRKGSKWGFEQLGDSTSDRHKNKMRTFTVQINGKKYGVEVKKHPRYGKRFFSVFVAKPNMHLTDSNTQFFQIEANSYKDAKNKISKKLREGKWR